LKSLQSRLDAGVRAPSAHIRALARLAGWADLRHQVLLHPILNLLFMWDLRLLQGMECWNRTAGMHVRSWFEVIGEFEALSSLAGLKELEPGSCFPDIADDDRGILALELGHPLLPIDHRVTNSLALPGRGAFWIVTGSNMAGKSTWLRAVGLNAALAFAGGPVCARQFVLPVLRIRSSMRIRDSLQAAASYFYAEVLKLKSLVADADAEPPIMFLCDELLRGTNAHDRTIGARAVVRHLASRGAMGIVATHDDALCDLCDEPGLSGQNVHFTDVLVNGDMTFDFKLRPGRATDGNALAVLARAGIPVPDEARSARGDEVLVNR
jgi:DNA mismatch repair ATPase MutS